ncbi:MAG: glycosyltransferase [Desulfobacteraceae bacterium]|jgi:UDP:flavonoid glycosyltransferase YjiC (YdhE family)|nr:glycosyltransferase [Desulfobacteraceae bacterium]
MKKRAESSVQTARDIYTATVELWHERSITDITLDAPDNIKIVSSAPHSQIFPHADAVVTHAGHGTVIRALAYGLPVVCLPMGRDQTDNAARVVHHGVGLKLSPKAKSAKISQVIIRNQTTGRLTVKVVPCPDWL